MKTELIKVNCFTLILRRKSHHRKRPLFCNKFRWMAAGRSLRKKKAYQLIFGRERTSQISTQHVVQNVEYNKSKCLLISVIRMFVIHSIYHRIRLRLRAALGPVHKRYTSTQGGSSSILHHTPDYRLAAANFVRTSTKKRLQTL